MESEIELKEGREADLRIIASRSEKGNATVELVGGKQELNKERIQN